VHLVGFIIRKFATIYGHMNVKKTSRICVKNDTAPNHMISLCAIPQTSRENGKEETFKNMGSSFYLKTGSAQESSPTDPGLVDNGTYHLTYLLTYSMVQSPSLEANWFTASQEIPRILWNPKVHYRTHKPPPPVPILG
jgi:hypothetical protein